MELLVEKMVLVLVVLTLTLVVTVGKARGNPDLL